MVQNVMFGGNAGMGDVGFSDEIEKDALIGGNAGRLYEENENIPSLYEPTPNLSSHGSDEAANLVRSIRSQDLLQFDNINSANPHQGLISPFPDIDSAYEEQTFPLGSRVASALNPSNTFPSLEEHDNARLEFTIHIQSTNGGKNCWYFSPQLSKVYIKMDQTFYVQAEYQRNEFDINLRVMLVCQDDVGMPVKRCNNHKATKDSATSSMCHQSESFIESVVRCENSNAKYLGKADGKNIKDRLSVLIPLNSLTADESNMVKETIALKFVCQNSCIGRRPTALIFSLEKTNGEVLGKKFLSVKICSCPKRDKSKDEEKCAMKRSADDANFPPVGKKIGKIAKIKDEPKDTPPNTPSSDVQIISEDGMRLELDVPDKEFAKQVLGFMYGQMLVRVNTNPGNKIDERYLKEYEALFIASKTKSENSDG